MKYRLIISLVLSGMASSASWAQSSIAADKDSHSALGDSASQTRNEALAQKKWHSGAEDCAKDDEPPIDVFPFDESTYVLRQNKCLNYEAPFIYVLFGEHTVLVHDTGATESPEAFPLYNLVSDLMKERSKLGYPDIQRIVVAHSHSHRDHTSADKQFENKDTAQLIEPDKDAILEFFGIADWPNELATIDLGDRELTIIPTPGHQEESISVYDPHTQWILTGDTFYPGNIYIKNWQTYKSSVDRLVDFTKHHDVSALMGSHIEMTNEPGIAYPVGATYQPNEAALPLQPEELYQLHAALAESGDKPESLTFDHFIITPLSALQKMIGGVLKWLTQ